MVKKKFMASGKSFFPPVEAREEEAWQRQVTDRPTKYDGKKAVSNREVIFSSTLAF